MNEKSKEKKLTQSLRDLEIGEKIIFPNLRYTRVAISRMHKRNVMIRYKTSVKGLYAGIMVERIK